MTVRVIGPNGLSIPMDEQVAKDLLRSPSGDYVLDEEAVYESESDDESDDLDDPATDGDDESESDDESDDLD